MENIVIKVGGSLLYNDDLSLNEKFLEKLKSWYELHKGNIGKLVIVVGGGKLSRNVGKQIVNLVETHDIHEVSMQITQVNAQIVKGFLKINNAFVPQHLMEAVEYMQREEKVVIITGGLKEGWSTDMDALVFANALKLEKVYKLSNIDYVYDSDPKENPNAKPIKQITWSEYCEMFDIKEGTEHKPNKSAPVSSEASIFAKNKGITMYISGGQKIYESNSLSEVFESGTVLS